MTKRKTTKATAKAPTVAALIVGIGGWEDFTLPLIQSIRENEPSCEIIVIDNASSEEYPGDEHIILKRTERLCYAAAINQAASLAAAKDWYVILSNDVLCDGPFIEQLTAVGDRVVCGPAMYEVHKYPFVGGWCVCTPVKAFDKVGGWDENYLVSSWEDVDYSTMAVKKGYTLAQVKLPFVHLDARQRFGLPEFAGTHERNAVYFHGKHDPK